MRPILLGSTIALATVACRPPTSTARVISVQLVAVPTVALTGDTVTFTVHVTASSVSDVVINYADGSTDQYAAGGVPSASVTFKHAYDDVGTYQARATVSDAVVGNRVVSQLIVVNARIDSMQVVGRLSR